MATFTPNNAEINEKMKLEKSLKENLEKERAIRLKNEIDQIDLERNRKQGAKKLKNCGILEAYSYFLENVCKHGLPKKDDIFDYAALCVLKYEKISKSDKMKQVQERHLKKLHRYDVEEPQSPPKIESPSPKQTKGKRAKSSTKEQPESPKGKGKGKAKEQEKGKITDKEATKGKGKGKRGKSATPPKSPPKSVKGAKGKKGAAQAPIQAPAPAPVKKGGKK